MAGHLPVSNNPRQVTLFLLLSAFFSTMSARLIVSPLVPDLMAAFEVSKAAMGLALTGMWAAYAVTQFPAGALGARFGERPLILGGLVVTGTGGLLAAVAPSFVLFALATGIVGIGAGLYFPSAVSLLTRLFRNTGQVLGLHLSGGDSAGLIIPVLATAVAANFGWRTALGIAPAIVAAVLVLCAGRLPHSDAHQREDEREATDLGTVLRLLTSPGLLFTMALAIVLAFTFQAIISFFPTFLVEYWQLSVGRAGVLFSVVFLLWILFAPLAGRLADAVGEDRVLGGLVLSMSVGVTVMLVAPTLRIALVGLGLLGVGMSWGGVLGARFMITLPASNRTFGYGLVRSVYVLLGAAGSVITGTLAEVYGWRAAYGLLVVLLATVGLLLLANRLFDVGL